MSNVPSLKDTILNWYTFENLYKLCFKEKSINTIFDCRWDIWRERAYVKYDVPHAFFDMPLFFYPRKISGVERYIEIATYYKLEDFSLIHRRDNVILGVYEPVALVLQALERNNTNIVDKYIHLLTPRDTQYLSNIFPQNNLAYKALCEKITSRKSCMFDEGIYLEEVAKGNFSFIEYLNNLDLYYLIERNNNLAFEEAMNRNIEEEFFFIACLKSGNVRYVDTILRQYIQISDNFSIEKNIPFLPFDPNRTNFPLYPLKYTKPGVIARYLNYALFGCNTQIVDFFRSYYKVDKPDNISSLYAGYILHRKPVETFSVCQRIDAGAFSFMYPSAVNSTSNTDLILYYLTKCSSAFLQKEVFRFVRGGNIPLIETIIAFVKNNYSPEETRTILAYTRENINPIFVLTRKLLEH